MRIHWMRLAKYNHLNAIAKNVTFIVTIQVFGKFHGVTQCLVFMPGGEHVIRFPRAITWSKAHPINNIFNEFAFRPYDTDIPDAIAHEAFNEFFQTLTLRRQ